MIITVSHAAVNTGKTIRGKTTKGYPKRKKNTTKYTKNALKHTEGPIITLINLLIMKIVRDKPEIKEMVFELKLDFKLIQPSALEIAMRYRGYNQTELSKKIEGLSQSNLSKFLKGNRNYLSDEVLKKIMTFLDFPFDFLYKEFKPLKTSLTI